MKTYSKNYMIIEEANGNTINLNRRSVTIYSKTPINHVPIYRKLWLTAAFSFSFPQTLFL